MNFVVKQEQTFPERFICTLLEALRMDLLRANLKIQDNKSKVFGPISKLIWIYKPIKDYDNNVNVSIDEWYEGQTDTEHLCSSFASKINNKKLQLRIINYKKKHSMHFVTVAIVNSQN